MPRFKVIHHQTGETWEVETHTPDEARRVVGWPEGICNVTLMKDEPFAELEPPKIAKQVTPPRPGSSHICPDCQVSLFEASSQGEFWWQCPSCDLFYHEWENRYYKTEEL